MSQIKDNLQQNAKRSARLSQPWRLPTTMSDASDRDFWVWADPGGLFTDFSEWNPKPPPPPEPGEPPPPLPMPDPEDPASKAQQKRKRATRDRGRSSTIFSDLADALGGPSS